MSSVVIGATLLAGGFSHRFGGDKRLHTDTTGEPMLLTTARLYSHVFADLVIVLRHQDRDGSLVTLLNRALPNSVSLSYAQQADVGMGYSLAVAAQNAVGWQGIFVGLGDMPFIGISTLQQLRDRLHDKLVNGKTEAIVQPSYLGQHGHPVGFSAHYLPRLTRLSGDVGAKDLVKQNAQHVVVVACDDLGVTRDIDVPSKLIT